MAVVFQCLECNTILGDAELQLQPSRDEGFEAKHATNIERSRGRVKCEKCKETVGNEDESGHVFFIPKMIKRYTIHSDAKLDKGRKKKRNDSEDEYVTIQEFDELKDKMLSDISDLKETVLTLYDRLDGRS